MTQIILRKEAISLELGKYFTGKPCKHGHVSEKYTKEGFCVECSKIKLRKYNKNNREKILQAQRNWVNRNREKVRKYNRGRYNAEESRIRVIEYRNKNPEKIKEINRNSYLKMKGTPLLDLRLACQYSARKLKINKLSNSKLELLCYSSEEFNEYLLKPFPEFKSIQEAHDAGYHIDNILPLKFISDNIKDQLLAFKISMDLENLRLIPSEENLKKNKNLTLQSKNLISVLWKRYIDDPEILLDLIDLEDE